MCVCSHSLAPSTFWVSSLSVSGMRKIRSRIEEVCRVHTHTHCAWSLTTLHYPFFSHTQTHLATYLHTHIYTALVILVLMRMYRTHAQAYHMNTPFTHVWTEYFWHAHVTFIFLLSLCCLLGAVALNVFIAVQTHALGHYNSEHSFINDQDEAVKFILGFVGWLR